MSMSMSVGPVTSFSLGLARLRLVVVFFKPFTPASCFLPLLACSAHWLLLGAGAVDFLSFFLSFVTPVALVALVLLPPLARR